MAKQWKQSLTSQDVTDSVWSDGATHLPGQGIDWSSKTPKVSGVTDGNTLSVTGSGFLVGIAPAENTNDAYLWDGETPALEIDGIEFTNQAPNGAIQFGDSGLNFKHPFQSSLKVGPREGYANLVVMYVLD